MGSRTLSRLPNFEELVTLRRNPIDVDRYEQINLRSVRRRYLSLESQLGELDAAWGISNALDVS
jgi:hypothetical protein